MSAGFPRATRVSSAGDRRSTRAHHQTKSVPKPLIPGPIDVESQWRVGKTPPVSVSAPNGSGSLSIRTT